MSAPRVLVTRAHGQADELVAAMLAVGLEPVLVPAIEINLVPDRRELLERVGRLGAYRWLVVTSANGADALIDATEEVGADPTRAAWAVLGDGTRTSLERRGVRPAFVATRPNAAMLAAELPVGPGDRVLVVRGDLAGTTLSEALRARGAVVDDVVAYRTTEAPAGSRGLLRSAVEAGPIAGVILTSGSTARGLRRLADAVSVDVAGLPAVCIGDATAVAAREAGFRVVAVAPAVDAATLAQTAAAALAGEVATVRAGTAARAVPDERAS